MSYESIINKRNNSLKAGATKGITLEELSLAFYVFSAIVFDGGSVVLRIARVLLAVTAVVVMTRKRFHFTSYYLWLLVLMAWILLSTTWAHFVDPAKHIAISMLVNYITLGCVVFLVIDDTNRFRVLVACLIVAPLFLEARIAIQYGTIAFIESRSAGETSANIIGLTAAVGAGLAFFLYWDNSIFSKPLGLAFTFLDCVVVILSASRKALLLAALLLLFIYVSFSRERRSTRATRLALVGIVLLGSLYLIMNTDFLYKLIGSRIDGLLNGLIGYTADADSSTTARLALINFGIDAFRSNPLIGYGGDNFSNLYDMGRIISVNLYAHNNYVELLVDYGLVGFAIYYSMYVYIAINAIKRIREAASRRYRNALLLCIGMLVALLVIEYGLVSYSNRTMQLVIALVWIASCSNTIRYSLDKNDF